MLVDLPLEQLKTYPGRNPRPADFDAYWDRALAEMRAVDPKIELSPHDIGADAGAECFDLCFTGVRGARVHAKYLRPRGAKGRHPAVLEFHGYTGHAGDWTDKLRWTSLGFSAAALDCRGQGGQSGDVGGVKGTTFRGHIIRGLDDAPDKLLFRDIFLDTAQLAGIVMGMSEVDPARVGCTGGSQGGGLTLACAALEPRIARAFRSSPSCATTSGCGRWTSRRTPTRSCATGSGCSIRCTSAKPRCSPAWATSTTSTSRPASGPRCSWPSA